MRAIFEVCAEAKPTLHAKRLSALVLAELTRGMAIGAGKPAVEGGQILKTAVERDIEDRAFRKSDQEIAGAAQSRGKDARVLEFQAAYALG